MLHRHHVVLQLVIAEILGHGEDAIGFGHQFSGFDCVDRLCGGYRAEGLGHRDDATGEAPDNSRLSGARRQNDDQRFTGCCGDVVVERYRVGGSRLDAARHGLAAVELISNADQLP